MIAAAGFVGFGRGDRADLDLNAEPHLPARLNTPIMTP